MAEWHLKEIENKLNQIGFEVTERKKSSERDLFIGGWIISRNTSYE